MKETSESQFLGLCYEKSTDAFIIKVIIIANFVLHDPS